MMNPELFLHEDETLEDLQLNGLVLLQKKNGFRFGMDSVLLADFADIKNNDSVVDFGTGTGIIPLLLIGRNKGKEFYGIEIQPDMAEMAERTIQLNGLTERFHLIAGDAEAADQFIPAGRIDAVICNPPYGQPGASLSSPYETIAISRNQKKDTLRKFFISAFRILKGKGKLFMVYPASQALFALRLLQESHLEPKKIRLVYPKAGKNANLILIEAVKDAKPMLQVLSPLIIYDKEQNLTNELKSVYHIE